MEAALLMKRHPELQIRVLQMSLKPMCLYVSLSPEKFVHALCDNHICVIASSSRCHGNNNLFLTLFPGFSTCKGAEQGIIDFLLKLRLSLMTVIQRCLKQLSFICARSCPRNKLRFCNISIHPSISVTA